MKKALYIPFAALTLSACNYLEIDPVGQVIPHKTSEFRALLTEGYRAFPYTSSRSFTGLLSDEVGGLYENAFYDTEYAVAFTYNFRWEYSGQMFELPYSYYYQSLFHANAVIENIAGADKDSEESSDEILGEAYALRAYNHFDLVNLYGKPYNPATAATDRGVPLYTHIDIEQRFRPATVAAVYERILSDIALAEGLIDVERQTDPTRNYRFSQDALQAFKARVMLYMGDWQQAYQAASALLPKYGLVDLNALGSTDDLPWKGSSPEAILAWERPFTFSSGDLVNASLLSDKMLALLDADTDNRRTYIKEVNSYDDNYNPTLQGYTVDRASGDRTSFRIAEMYLIAAEAGAHLADRLPDAKQHLLALQAKRFKTEAMETQRAKVEAMDAQTLLQEIADERARELLYEGHRWMDLRRTTQPQIQKTYNGSTYTLQAGDSRYTLPFPQSAVEDNPDLNE